MLRLRYLLTTLFVANALIGYAQAENNTHNFYRNFWYPTYNAQRLNYCELDKQTCGVAVANKYCNMMGYEKSDKAIIDYNVGLTHFIFTQARCTGWTCNGFMLITCVGNFSHKPAENYYYRLQRFAFPQMDNYRVDWCNKHRQGCGRRAAYSFCRRMGYMSVKSYKKQAHIASSKALGNGKLCFGKDCNGFSQITCYR